MSEHSRRAQAHLDGAERSIPEGVLADRGAELERAIDLADFKDNYTQDDLFDPEARRAKDERNSELGNYLSTRPSYAPKFIVIASTEERPGERTLNEDGDITQSFNVPVVAIHSRSKMNKLGMMIDDVRDIREYPSPPPATEYSGPESALLTERILPADAIEAIRRVGSYYPDGYIQWKTDHVGNSKIEDKRNDPAWHPHYYFIDRSHEGVTRMYFVDPEHKVAKDNLFRPSIANLVGIEVPDDETQSSRVAILRYQIPRYDYQNKPVGLGHHDLRSVIEQTLDNGGNLPEELTGEAERKVLFMIASDHEKSRVQARYSTKRQVESFARGDKGSSALEGKVMMQGHVVNKLIRLFNHPEGAHQVRDRHKDS